MKCFHEKNHDHPFEFSASISSISIIISNISSISIIISNISSISIIISSISSMRSRSYMVEERCVVFGSDKWIYCPRYRTEKESRSSGRCSWNNYALTFSSLLRGLWAEKNRHLILKNLFIEHQSFLHLCPAVVTSTRYTSYSQC